MERLTERDGKWTSCNLPHGEECPPYELCECEHFHKMRNKLAEYEDLEEQGRLIVLPVAEGEIVYALGYIIECEYDYDCQEIDAYKCECDAPCEHEYKVYRVNEAKFQKHMLPMIGKNIFLTKAEAEKALAEMKGE